MESRFVSYNCLISYLGGLDKESFGEALIEALGAGPKFIPRITQEVNLMEYEGTQIIKIDFIYYIEKGIFNEEEKIKYVKELKSTIHDAIYNELKAQKILFNFETE